VKAEDILGMMVPATYLVMAVVEKIFPARKFPNVPWWNLLGVVFLVLMGLIGAVGPLLLPPDWVAAHRLFDGTRLGVLGGVLVGYPIVALFGMAIHRGLHASSWLWRWTHQMHHAPKRVDIPGAAFFHPFDALLQSTLSLAVATFVLGVGPLASAIVGYVALFYALFQHWNVKTPRILGYLIQRPESHCVHHARDVHAYNYSDFPLWDILFGTFRNPAAFEGAVGFAEPAPIAKMLIGVDVHADGTPNARPVATASAA
jgi:sterol desaturase/sphingolipid hydroxylase (fatty acid hydroxylase superfamily)